MTSFRGRTAVVTGAAHGIGRSTAELLAEHGAQVVAVDIDQDALDRAFADTTISPYPADLAANGLQLAAALAERYGQIQLLVNNVGIDTPDRFLTLNDAKFDQVFATNLRGPWFLTRGLSQAMIDNQQPGSIVFVSSLHDTFIRTFPHYSSSKAAVSMLARKLAAELGPYRIRVNTVSPGVIRTHHVPAPIDERDRERLRTLIPLGRVGDPVDVARVIVMLLDDEHAGYVTGTNVRVDGGWGCTAGRSTNNSSKDESMRVSSRGRSARRTTARRRDRQPRRWRRIFVDLPIQAQRIPPPYIVLILATSGVLAYVAERAYWKKESCNAHPLQCGATGGIASILIVAVIGIVAFMWLTRHVRREYLWLARNEPQRLFPAGVTPPSADADIESAEQIRELSSWASTDDAIGDHACCAWRRCSPPPKACHRSSSMQAGEGKTTLLLQLTSQLAKEDMVPVPVSLQDVREFESFLDLAREQFRQTVDEELASTDEGDRVCRWICRNGRLVVLADDLHLLEGPARTRLAAAFHEADRRHFALVVASRRDGIGPVLERWRVPIGRLSVHEACEKVSKDPAIDRIQLFTIIQPGELNASRYYLSVPRRMLQHGQPLPPVTKGSMPLEVRRSLLDCYLLAFIEATSCTRIQPEKASGSRR